MLLWLTEFLERYVHFFRVFQYLTFRSILCTLTALFIALLVGPTMIRRLSSYNVGKKSGHPDHGWGINSDSNRH